MQIFKRGEKKYCVQEKFVLAFKNKTKNLYAKMVKKHQDVMVIINLANSKNF